MELQGSAAIQGNAILHAGVQHFAISSEYTLLSCTVPVGLLSLAAKHNLEELLKFVFCLF